VRRRDLLDFLAREIAEQKQAKRPLKVAIDGRCASGKTVLADELASILAVNNLEVLRPSVDGFHHTRERRYRKGEYSAAGYYEDAWDYEAVIRLLLGPLSGDVFPVLCRQVARDVRTDMPDIAQPVSVGTNTVLLFEGLFLFRHELDRYWDFRILVDIDAATSLRRAIERDTGLVGPAEFVQRKYELRYGPAWQMYVDAEHPETKADVIIDNRDLQSPKLIPSRNREGVV
jgi:uridine kinase